MVSSLLDPVRYMPPMSWLILCAQVNKIFKQLTFGSLVMPYIYCILFSFPHLSHMSGPPCDMWSLWPIHN